MSTIVRTVLVFLAAATAAFAAAPPVDLPGWAAALIAALAAGFAGLGILPPSWVQSGTHTAVKRNRPTRAQELDGNVKRRHELPKMPSNHIKAVRARLAAAILAVAVVAGVLSFASPAQAYIHEDAARSYCISWNNQAAVDNIRYVEDSMVRPHWNIWTASYPTVRYGNNDVRVTTQWHEWLEAWQGRLAIDYACRVQGTDDAHMTITAIAGSAVYWI